MKIKYNKNEYMCNFVRQDVKILNDLIGKMNESFKISIYAIIPNLIILYLMKLPIKYNIIHILMSSLLLVLKWILLIIYQKNSNFKILLKFWLIFIINLIIQLTCFGSEIYSMVTAKFSEPSEYEFLNNFLQISFTLFFVIICSIIHQNRYINVYTEKDVNIPTFPIVIIVFLLFKIFGKQSPLILTIFLIAICIVVSNLMNYIILYKRLSKLSDEEYIYYS